VRAEVAVLVSDAELADPANPDEALRLARGAVSKLGVPNEGAVTASLLGDGYRVDFYVDGITA
jgi:guanyl-specific ribonuclease Sa